MMLGVVPVWDKVLLFFLFLGERGCDGMSLAGES